MSFSCLKGGRLNILTEATEEDPMDYFNVAMLQLLPTDTQQDNLAKGIEYCKRAKSIGADIAVFPEMWSTGYALSSNIDEMRRSAIGSDSQFVTVFQNLAKELEMAIGITYLERHETLPRNTLNVFNRFGERVLTYSKVHTCDFDVERNLSPGDDFYVVDLNTKSGVLKLGAMICYDREFPESARILMLKGAEIIIVPNACPMEINRLSQLRARAYENMLGIATVNYPSGQPDCNGHSSAFDGIAYGEIRPGHTEARDTLIIEAGEAEGIFLASFPMGKIREYRKREIHGNAYRRPSKYKIITDEVIKEPFIRPDYRK